MRILLTNDDGYSSKGINMLKVELEKFGHNCVIVAPKVQHSAMSMSITTIKALKAERFNHNIYVVNGTPADCVLASFRVLKEELNTKKFDLLISGINEGANLSTDILYSGTCSAAKQGALLGLKSIAISACIENDEEKTYVNAANFLAKNLDKFYDKLNTNSFLNINFPSNYNGKGFKVSTISKINYNSLNSDLVDRQIVANTKESDKEIDVEVVQDGYVSVSAIKVQPSIDYKLESQLLTLT